jgi:hypothetical protein
MSVLLATNLNDADAVPYFLWDEPMSVTEFKLRLQSASLPERERLFAKLLREARDTDVWQFTTPAEVRRNFPALARQLGRRRAFWEFLLTRWQADGLLDD